MFPGQALKLQGHWALGTPIPKDAQKSEPLIHSLDITYTSWVFVQSQGDGGAITKMENETSTSPTGMGLEISSLSQFLCMSSM